MKTLHAQKRCNVVAAIEDDGQPVVVPYARGAKLAQNLNGAFILFGGAGVGATKTRLLDDENLQDESWVVTGLAQFGFELSYSHFCFTGGVDASVPSGKSIRFSVSDSNDPSKDKETIILPQPWGGFGAYILRPYDHSYTLLIAGTIEYLFPAHTGYGGRVVFGLPFKDGKAWFRFTLGGAMSPKPNKEWQALEPYRDASFTKVHLGFSGGGRF